MTETKEEKLDNKRVAILATDGFEESELVEPRRALIEAGASVDIVAPKGENVRSWNDENWGAEFRIDCKLEEADSDDYDALVLPGGVINADRLRLDSNAVSFVRDFASSRRPIAVICHGAWILIETDLVEGRTLTSWPGLRTDLVNAGAEWVDEEVVVDDGWVSSRMPTDLPAFNQKMIEEFWEGRHRPIGTTPKPGRNRSRAQDSLLS